MIVAPDKRTVFFDVDDTLIMWGNNPRDEGLTYIPSHNGGHGIYVRLHNNHINRLKDLKGIGWFVVVWSQGGADHAANVVKHLKLEPYVDLIVSKPEIYFDDLPFQEQGIARKYLSEN